MANLCIKTPSSASLVLIFQLLVLRPRPIHHHLALTIIIVLSCTIKDSHPEQRKSGNMLQFSTTLGGKEDLQGGGDFFRERIKLSLFGAVFRLLLCTFHCLEEFYLRQPLLSVLGEEKNISKKRTLRIFWIWFATFAILIHSMQILANHFSAQKCVNFFKIDFTKDLAV